MPLQSRVNPFGELFADPALGLFMGNRGGRIHTGERTLARRRWTSRQWICCVLDFKGRHRSVWRDGVHRTVLPRRARRRLPPATGPASNAAGAMRWPSRNAGGAAFGLEHRPRASEMDVRLHDERLVDGGVKRSHTVPATDLLDGAFVVIDGRAFAVRGTGADLLGAGRLRGAPAAAARGDGGGADAARDPCAC